MRALTTIVLSYHATCKSNDVFNPYANLNDYLTTRLACDDRNDGFRLIGLIKKSRYSDWQTSPQTKTEFIPLKDKLTKDLSDLG